MFIVVLLCGHAFRCSWIRLDRNLIWLTGNPSISLSTRGEVAAISAASAFGVVSRANLVAHHLPAG